VACEAFESHRGRARHRSALRRRGIEPTSGCADGL